jgi:osmotically-inducible protein OsmY
MKKLLTLLALTSVTVASANQNYQPAANAQNNLQNEYEARDYQLGNSDQEANKEIRKALGSGWFSKGFDHVTFHVQNGNVNLRGTVDSVESKEKIEEKVKSIKGIATVTNNITVVESGNAKIASDNDLEKSENKYPQDFAATYADRQLNARIRDKVSGGWLSKGYETLVLKTANGIVIITGNVKKPEEVQKITQELKGIEGVKAVNNQLTISNQ